MNVDQLELQKFNTLAREWWDENGGCRFLHRLNPLRMEWIEKFSPLDGKKVLDVGCGGGILCESMARRGAIVTGIDLADDVIGIAKTHCEQSLLDIDYRKISAESLSRTEAGTYDIITCLEILEHIPDPAAMISAIKKLIRPGGMIYFSTINRNIRSFLCAIIAAEYILNLIPRGTHLYNRLVTPAELSRQVRQANMEVIAISGIKSNLSVAHFEFSSDVSINYIMACKNIS